MEKKIAEKIAKLSPYGREVYETALEQIELSPFSRKEMLSIVALLKETIESRPVKKVEKSCD